MVYNIFDNGDNIKRQQTGCTQKMMIATVCLYITGGPRQIDIYMLKEGIAYDNLTGILPGADITLKTLYQVQ